MRRRRRSVARLHGGVRAHFEVAAVVSVLGLGVMGGPLLAETRLAASPLTVPAAALMAPALMAPAPAVPAAPDATSWFRPGGANDGTEDLALGLASLALDGNEPLYLSGTWGRTWGSAKSDHHVSRTDSWAIDLAVAGIQRPTSQTDEAARRVADALGHPGWAGGDLQVTIEGYRFQVLWRVAGHFNHVHVGVRKV